MAHVEVPAVLYHGTSLANAHRILRLGLRPRMVLEQEGVEHYSPHHTETKNATFLTDSLAGALMYAQGVTSGARVILAIRTAGLDIDPDYDDADDLISVDLEAFSEELGEPATLGMELTEEQQEQFFDWRERHSDDLNDRLPCALDVCDGKLCAEPFVGLPFAHVGADDHTAIETLEWADGGSIQWRDGAPTLTIRQYRCLCSIEPERITAYEVRDTTKGAWKTAYDYDNPNIDWSDPGSEVPKVGLYPLV
jgi:hypothetical protein